MMGQYKSRSRYESYRMTGTHVSELLVLSQREVDFVEAKPDSLQHFRYAGLLRFWRSEIMEYIAALHAAKAPEAGYSSVRPYCCGCI